MAIILNIETATTNCSVSIAKEGILLGSKEYNSAEYSHAEQLHVFIEDTLKEAALSLAQINAIAVSKGPGSYTGLRIGVSAAKGLCFALDIPLISVATLKSIAQQVKEDEADFIIPVLDARRMEVYSCVFDKALNEVRETKAEIIDEHSFEVFTAKGKIILIGSGAEKCKEFLQHHPNVVFKKDAVPSAKDMALLSYKKFKANKFESVAYFEPFYLKDFILQKKS
jgi:tRNA threonylcarbamoyladenosine biosynthesis protein TsaB